MNKCYGVGLFVFAVDFFSSVTLSCIFFDEFGITICNETV